MHAKSAKAKGRRLENWLVDFFKDIDPLAHRVVGSGSGKNKGDVQLPSLKVAIEAKNQKRYALTQWLQDRKDEQMANDMVALAFRDPESPEHAPVVYAVLPIEDFHALLKARRSEDSTTDRLPAWLVRRTVDALKQVLRHLE